jgi:hypothetical protein
MKTFVKVFLFFSGLVVSLAGALAIFYKLFKKHCVIHIEFNPAEENTHENYWNFFTQIYPALNEENND